MIGESLPILNSFDGSESLYFRSNVPPATHWSQSYILSHTDIAFAWNNDNNTILTTTTFLSGFSELVTVLQAFVCIISFTQLAIVPIPLHPSKDRKFPIYKLIVFLTFFCEAVVWMVKPLSHINNVISGCGWPHVPLPQSVVYPSHPDGPPGIYREKEYVWSGYTIVTDTTHAGKTDVRKKMFAHFQCQLLEKVLTWKGTANFPRWTGSNWLLLIKPDSDGPKSDPKNGSHWWE